MPNVRFRPKVDTSRGFGWVVVDSKGGQARITIANVMQSNCVIHAVDRVLMP